MNKNVPNKTGSYNILYARAKSSDITKGTGRFNAHTGKWTKIVNARTGREVTNTFDYRDYVDRSPRVVSWAQL